MKVKDKKMGKKYRVVEAGTRKIEKKKKGTALDGGGHSSRAKAIAQEQAVNISLKKRGKI